MRANVIRAFAAAAAVKFAGVRRAPLRDLGPNQPTKCRLQRRRRRRRLCMERPDREGSAALAIQQILDVSTSVGRRPDASLPSSSFLRSLPGDGAAAKEAAESPRTSLFMTVGSDRTALSVRGLHRPFRSPVPARPPRKSSPVVRVIVLPTKAILDVRRPSQNRESSLFFSAADV